MTKDKRTEARRRGDIGETIAARYLRRRFYRILARNWFFHRKEIDIVAKRGRTLVICEVKARTQAPGASLTYGSPSAAVDAEKQANLLTAAEAFARSIGWQGNIRMDVIEVYLPTVRPGRRPRAAAVVHIKSAFTA